ncbi:IS256 family transposase [Azospirillum sp. SYSU D00513]|uniref:IS256 family transposase n=1 Tax=Azospirillum sp. SYSU D00513 TaxID=2812561 RepID=UPI001A973B5B|nr:IS256 family transposase [Azospirillum sp. SYSU D00513]
MPEPQDTIIATLMEQLIQAGPDGMAQAFTALFNLAMRLERERHLGAEPYERSADRRGYANGYKPKTLDTPAGTVTVQVPKTRDTDEPFYPQSLERGRRSCRAVMLAVAEMYVKGVSTRDAAKVTAEFGLKSLSSMQVSRAAALLDEELQAWRSRPLGTVSYLPLDARYEKVRKGGVVRDAAILSAIGIDPDGRRHVLGVCAALSEAEVHWRAFLDDLVARGLRGVRFITSDDHAGLRAARQAVFPGARWQRCHFHLAQNAIQHAPDATIRKSIGADLRQVWNASTLPQAEEELKRLVQAYQATAPKLAGWLESAVPEGLTVFRLPDHHRRRMRTANPIERAIQQEIKRRTTKVRVFPNESALLRLVTAILIEIDKEWATTDRVYINMNDRDD